MNDPLKAVAFDLDAASLRCLLDALPDWEIEVVSGASTSSFSGDWNPGGADLLVLMAREEAAETLELCRLLLCCGDLSAGDDSPSASRGQEETRGQRPRPEATLVVLVPPRRENLAADALESGADACLVLPLCAKELLGAVTRAHAGRQPRLCASPHRAHEEDWRDEGGQG
jgi:hypothetical protein